MVMDTIDIVVKRINEMESILEEALRRMDMAEEVSKALLAYQSEIKKLDEYYSSQDWKDDLALDEDGRLPKDLKRGVLSEDGIYNALERNKELMERIKGTRMVKHVILWLENKCGFWCMILRVTLIGQGSYEKEML